jgi:small neutral amino acid transporter SnatA (MarC family)
MAHPLFHDLVTLIVVVNPIGLVPLFIGVAGQESAPRRKQIALQAVLIAACILLAFIAIGQIMLEALGIELASFQLAGGLVLLIIACEWYCRTLTRLPSQRFPINATSRCFRSPRHSLRDLQQSWL